MDKQLSQLFESVSPQTWPQFLISISLCIVFSYILKAIYRAHASRAGTIGQTSDLLPLLSLTVFLVIVTVKQSLALSLGLVGALSIVRFRTPVKEAEDLIYYFISIGIGLGFGANQNFVTVSALLVIFAVLIFQTFFRQRYQNGSFTLKLQSSKIFDDEVIHNILAENCFSVEINRKETSGDANLLVFTIGVKDVAALKKVTDQMTTYDENMDVSIIEAKGHW